MLLHHALNHFPLALLLTGAAWLILDLVRGRRKDDSSTATTLLLIGALMTIPTVGAGLWAGAGHEGHHGNELSDHRLLGIATMTVALLASFIHLLRSRYPAALLARHLLFIGAAILAVATGYVGGEMAHPDPPTAMLQPHAAEHDHGH